MKKMIEQDSSPKSATGTLYSKYKPVILACIAFLLPAFLVSTVIYQRYQVVITDKKHQAYEALSTAFERMQHTISYGHSAAKTLSFFIDDNGRVNNFDSIAAEIISTNNYIDAIQLVPGGVIKYVYPLKENQALLGFDILNDSLRNKEAYKAIEKKEFFIAGPFELKQGGMAVVGRLPVFRKNKFWGFSAVIIKVSNLFKAAGIDGSGTSGYYFQLSKLNPNTHEVEYFLPLHPERNEANDVAINIHNAEWKLSATPVQLNIGYADIILLAAFGFLIALLGGYFVYRVVKSPELLNNLVNERTAQLKESEVKYRTIIEQASDGIILYSLDGTIHEFNNSAYLLSGNTKEEFQQLSLTDILFEKKVIINESKVKELNEGKSTIIYRKIKRKDGSHIEVEVNAKLLSDGKIIAIVRDITERLKAEAEIKNINLQLRELAGHLVQIREEERINIAREIHDDLGQQLTSLKMDIFWLNRKLNKEEVEIKQRTENALQLIDETIISVRRIATTLRPSIIDDLGLIAALEWQSSEFEKRSGIKVNFINNINDILLQPIVVTSLFRIYQELLTNVSRHAKANTINTVIGINSDQLYFSVSDDGIGFDMKTIINEKTLGLMGIKERSFFMEGHYEIITQPGKGTKVIITVPVQKAIQNN